MDKSPERVAAEEEYARIVKAIRCCTKVEWLRDVWIGSQADIALLPAAWRAELTAEKDRIKAKLQAKGGAA